MDAPVSSATNNDVNDDANSANANSVSANSANVNAAENTKPAPSGPDLDWVWREVRKRVFLKVPFGMGIKDALEAANPIAFDDDHFVVGLHPRDSGLTSNLTTAHIKNTIENILSSASHRPIKLEVIEGVSETDWHLVRNRRQRAHEAVVAMAQKSADTGHFDDVLNQIVGEIRANLTGTKDRGLPQVRAQMLLDVVPSLGDASEMLFPDPDAHEARRAMARAIDRVASFLEVQPVTLALEVERYRRHESHGTKSQTRASNAAQAN